MQTFITRPPSGGAVVRVEGSFDTPDAEPLCSIASALDACGQVTLDFHEARAVTDCAVARLARGLVEAQLHATLVGLTDHQHRLLKYIVPGRASHGSAG